MTFKVILRYCFRTYIPVRLTVRYRDGLGEIVMPCKTRSGTHCSRAPLFTKPVFMLRSVHFLYQSEISVMSSNNFLFWPLGTYIWYV